MTPTVELIAVPEALVVCRRARGPVREMAARRRYLLSLVRAAGLVPAGPVMARFFEADFSPEDTDFDVCLPIAADEDGPVPDAIAGATTAVIPRHQAFVARHHGPYSGLGEAHAAVAGQIAALGYALAGPVTEVYLWGPDDEADSAAYVTEVRYPIAR